MTPVSAAEAGLQTPGDFGPMQERVLAAKEYENGLKAMALAILVRTAADIAAWDHACKDSARKPITDADGTYYRHRKFAMQEMYRQSEDAKQWMSGQFASKFPFEVICSLLKQPAEIVRKTILSDPAGFVERMQDSYYEQPSAAKRQAPGM